MRVGIIGFYGFGNIGDDVLLLSTSSMLEKLGATVEFATFGNIEYAKMLEFQGKALSVPIKDKGLLGSFPELLNLSREIASSDLIVIGGGRFNP